MRGNLGEGVCDGQSGDESDSPGVPLCKLIGLGVVMGAELNAALADAGGTALEGERYDGPFEEELKVEAPAPDEKVNKGVAA